MTDTNKALWIENLFFAFSSKHTQFQLSIPSLALEKGERVALVGPSGSGKSTLLGLICGVLSPRRGQLKILGHSLEQMSHKQRDKVRADTLGIIFQQFNLLPYLSVLDNVVLALEFSHLRSLTTAEKRQRAKQLLQALDIDTTHMMHQKVSQLSVGQQQRVAAARAFVGDPPLIIADEPTSALDEGRQNDFINLLFAQQQRTEATLLMVTHDPRVAKRFDRVLNMQNICLLSSTQEASSQENRPQEIHA